MKKNDLRHCPFCGGEAEVRDGHIFMTDTKVVTCKKCHVRTTPVSVDHPNFTANGLDESTRYTPEQAAQKACEMWNRRENDSFPRWISVEERLPENDVPVLASAKRKRWDGKEYRTVFTAFHTDGTTHTEDSGYGWDDCLNMKYCEETDDYIVPEAWWEDVRYGEEFSKVYDTDVTHWMPLPEPPKEVQHE